MIAKESHFANSTEVVDGNTYDKCIFKRCRIVYRGGELPKLIGCRLDDCTFHFEDAADRTLMFLKGIFHGMGPMGRQVVENTFKEIRQPIPPASNLLN